QEGKAEVTLGFRKFVIKKQFVEDLKQIESEIGNLRKALLVMHSPMDSTVKIAEAEKIYKDAKHPKSFVSLDNADHLVSNKDDAEYIATTIAAWASRYIEPSIVEKSGQTVAKGHVYVEEKDHKFAQNVYSNSHHWLADEP
ncbi:osmotically inducible protein C, partial [Vibrio parahaemolyticus]|nr:osmotically inducible protein C [Vibrio parahaemolyticus]